MPCKSLGFLFLAVGGLAIMATASCASTQRGKGGGAPSKTPPRLAALEAIPEEYYSIAAGGGTLEKISYATKDYFGDGSKIVKSANVYLPAGYKARKRYAVLYLMHGIGGTENEWGMRNESSVVKSIMDRLSAKGEIEPFIIVTPNGRSSKDFANTGSDYNSFYKFGLELRNELIPYMDRHYSTYADRDHRAMAGLSMGGMQTINIGLCECLDLIGWFGAFSAAPTSYQAQAIAREIGKFKGAPVHYFYSICGLEDGVAFGPASGAAKALPSVSGEFVDGRNFSWQEIHGGHDFNVWNLGFFNFARIVFKAPTE